MSKLKFKYGSMNSSKSANLIMEWYNHQSNNKRAMVFKPKSDTRAERFVTSRALYTTIPAHVVSEDVLGYMYKMVEKVCPSVVFVDEIQFFSPEQIEELSDIVDFLGVSVQAYGLLTTFKGELFEGSRRMVELADEIERIPTECNQCANEGVINSRQTDGVVQTSGETIVVGEEDVYKVLCRKCFKKATNHHSGKYIPLQ